MSLIPKVFVTSLVRFFFPMQNSMVIARKKLINLCSKSMNTIFGCLFLVCICQHGSGGSQEPLGGLSALGPWAHSRIPLFARSSALRTQQVYPLKASLVKRYNGLNTRVFGKRACGFYRFPNHKSRACFKCTVIKT